MKLENKIEKVSYDLASILSQLAYHIHPSIINMIQENNKKDYMYFKYLFRSNIDVDDYLFDGSACVFPGVKRYISGEGVKGKYNEIYKSIIDDNTFPRHIWCFLSNSKIYTGPNWIETGLNEFELAHIFAHKKSEIENEIVYFTKYIKDRLPYGKFTCAANVILLPKGTVRPTDNSMIIKSVFYKRYLDLYGEATLGSRFEFKNELIPGWYSKLKWNEPYLPENWKEKVEALLAYRKKKISEIMKNV